MYGKIFRQMYRGTLATVGPWQALVTFQQMIVLADIEGIVDMTADAIARETTIPLDIIKLGIDVLELPDPDSRSPDEDGRRIVRLSDNRRWGWKIVNFEHYRKLKSEEEKREYHRQYWREKRSPSLKQLKTTQTNSSNSIQAEAEAEAEGIKHKRERESRFAPPALAEVEAFMDGKGKKPEADRFMNHYISNGWRVGKNPMKSWRAAAAQWLTRDFGDRQSNKTAAERITWRPDPADFNPDGSPKL